jgi:hypothetical protein
LFISSRIYYAEKQLVKALPKLADKATSPKLVDAFESHLKDTRQHVERLERVFEICGRAPRAVTCAAIQGILEEGKEIMIREGATFPDCTAHPKLTTIWKQVDVDIENVVVLTKKSKAEPAG